MRCPNCKKALKPGGNFCPHCGAPLSARRPMRQGTPRPTRRRSPAAFVVLVIGALVIFVGVLASLSGSTNIKQKTKEPPPPPPVTQQPAQEPQPEPEPKKQTEKEPPWKKEVEALEAELKKIKSPKDGARFVIRLEMLSSTAEGEFAEALKELHKKAAGLWKEVSLKAVESMIKEALKKGEEKAVSELGGRKLEGYHEAARARLNRFLATLKRRVEERKKRRKEQDEQIAAIKQQIERLYREGRFREASDLAAKLCALMRKWGRSKEEVFGWADRMAKRARVFALIVARIPKSPLATHKNIWRIELVTKAVHYGRILSDDGEYVLYQKEGGVKIKLRAERIKSKTPVSPKEYKSYLEVCLARRIKGLGKWQYLRLYTEGVVFARRYGLDEHLAGLLERVFGMRGSERLLGFVLGRGSGDEVVALLEGMGRYEDARAFREAVEARQAALDRLPKIPGLTARQKDELLDALEAQKKADELIGRAINEFGRARFRLGSEALKVLKQAQKVLKRLWAAHPDSKFLEQKLAEVTSAIGFVQKVLTGFVK